MSCRIVGPVLLVMLVLCACGHDSKRDNPLDPALTPSVQLQVVVNDSAGVATLTWTPFEGEVAFAEYRVVRNEAERTIVDTLAILSSIAQTSFVDSSLVPETSYSYRVLSVNTSGLEATSDPRAVRLSTPSAVEIELVDLDSGTASAAVKWSQYTGREFDRYQLVRSAGFERQVVAETQNLLDTTFVDTNLKGNIEYSYEVVVHTDWDESISSTPMTGVFHQLVDSWPVDVEDGGYVRLYKQDDQLVMLVSEPQRIRLITLDPDGSVLEEQVLLEDHWLDIAPFAVGLTTAPDGTRYLGFVRRETGIHTAMLLAFDNQGQPLYQTEHSTPPLDLHDFADQHPEFDVDAPFRTIGVSRAIAFDNLIVSSDGRELLAEDFSSANLDDWTSGCGPVTATEANVEEGEVVVEPIRSIRRVVQTDGNNLVLEVDLTPSGERPPWAQVYTVNACEDFDFSQGFSVGASSQGLFLATGVQDARDEVLGSTTVWQEAFAPVPGLAYKLRLDVEDGVPRASVTSPTVWSQSLESDILSI